MPVQYCSLPVLILFPLEMRRLCEIFYSGLLGGREQVEDSFLFFSRLEKWGHISTVVCTHRVHMVTVTFCLTSGISPVTPLWEGLLPQKERVFHFRFLLSFIRQS